MDSPTWPKLLHRHFIIDTIKWKITVRGYTVGAVESGHSQDLILNVYWNDLCWNEWYSIPTGVSIKIEVGSRFEESNRLMNKKPQERMAVSALSLGGSGGMLPQKILKF